jgi:integrase
MAKFNFNLRDQQSKVKTPVNFIIRWNNNRLVYPTGLTILPKDWENDKSKGKKYQRAKPTLIQSPEFNSSLISIENTAVTAFNRFVNDNNRQPNITELRDLLNKSLNKKSTGKLNFFQYFEKFIEESKQKTNDKTKKPLSTGTISVYNTALKHLREYAQTKRIRVDFDTIDLDLYYNYNKYLSTEKKFGENNKGKLIKVIKTVLNDATERGLNTNMAYKSKRFKVVSEDVENIYLTDKELSDLLKHDLSKNKRLDRVRDLFYIGCNTGLRFSDLGKVTKENIIDGQLHVKTIKTNESVVIPLKKEIFTILKKYEGNFPTSLSNQKMNEYIKEICSNIDSLKKKVEITHIKDNLKITENIEKYKLISTHTARRSAATNWYKMGIPSIVIMGVTGHRTESSFLKYIKITSNDKANIMQMYLSKNQKSLKLKVV